MSGRQAGGESGSPGRRAAASHSYIAAMQLFHELKQQFPALPDHAVSACIAQHCHDAASCHHQLSQTTTPRHNPYPATLRNMDTTDYTPTPANTDSNFPANTDSLKAGIHQQVFSQENKHNHRINSVSDESINSYFPAKTDNLKVGIHQQQLFSQDCNKATFFSKENKRNDRINSVSDESIKSNFPAKTDNSNLNKAGNQRNQQQKSSSVFSQDCNKTPSFVKENNYNDRINSVSAESIKSYETKRFSDVTSRARSAFFGLESVDNKKPSETLKTRSLFENSSQKMNEIVRTNFENEKSPRFGKKFSEIPSPSDEFKKLKISKGANCSLSVDRTTNTEATTTRKSSVVNDRTSPPSPSETKDFSAFSKPPISPLTSKRPPKATYDARISKLPDEGLTNTNTGAVKKTPVRPATLDLPSKTSDSVEPVVNLSVNVNVDVEQKGQGARRHSAVLEVTPEPTWLHQTPPSPRSFTSVNLTLRTPTTPPQGPINICSSPPSFTYTTNSWDRRQGLQSRLQITVGPAAGVGTVSAMRSRPRSCHQDYQEEQAQREKTRAESMPDLCQVQESTNRVVLISRQKERKEQLRNEVKVGKERLYAIQKEIQGLRLENTPDYRTRLKKEIKHLQAQCERLTREVDRHSESRVPLGETNEEFYRHIYTGQRHPSQRRRTYNAAGEDNEPRWPCHICTFRNHPSMDKCEVCEMPRMLLVSAGPGENIHIRFSPGTTTRVIHSWVV